MTLFLLAAIITNYGIMPPTNVSTRVFPAHAAPTNQTVVTLGWLNDVTKYPSWGWEGGSTITNTNGLVIWSTNGGHWVAHYLDLNAASNDLRTGIYTLTNLHAAGGILRTSLPFALTNRVTLRMSNTEFLRAFYGPKSQ